MNDLVIQKEADKKLKEVGDDVKIIITEGNKIFVKNDEGLAVATEFLGDLKGRIKEIDDARIAIVKPIGDSVKKINNAFKMRIDPLQKIEKTLKGKAKVYVEERDKKVREEAERLQKIKEAAEKKAQKEADRKTKEAEDARKKVENAKNDKAREKAEKEAEKAEEAAEEAEAAKEEIENEAVEVEVAPKSVRTEGGLMSTRKVWKFVIVDVEKIPKGYMTIDEKRINQAIKNGTREISGIHIFQDTQIAIRN